MIVRSCKHQSGFGLIEVLVALLIIAIGTISSAQMLVTGIQDAQNTYHQSQANLLLSEMIDRMRSNPQGVADNAYLNLSTRDATNPGCSVGCSAKQQAELDMYAWSAHFQSHTDDSGYIPTLPADDDGSPAYGVITAGANDTYLLTVTWADLVAGKSSVEVVTSRFHP